MTAPKSSLLKTKRPGKDLNDRLFFEILDWTNDNASNLLADLLQQDNAWTPGQIEQAIRVLPEDVDKPLTARQHLRSGVPHKPLLSVSDREVSKAVHHPKPKGRAVRTREETVATIDLYCQCQAPNLELCNGPQLKLRIGWDSPIHVVFDIRTSLEPVTAILRELSELRQRILEDNRTPIKDPVIAVISPDNRNATLIRAEGYHVVHCRQFAIA